MDNKAQTNRIGSVLTITITILYFVIAMYCEYVVSYNVVLTYFWQSFFLEGVVVVSTVLIGFNLYSFLVRGDNDV